MLVSELKKYSNNESEIRRYGLDCYEENCFIDDDNIDYLNENGESVYSIECGTRGEITIEKITDKNVLNSDLESIQQTEEERENSEVWIDYFYYKI
jgi:hypothetical protein